MKPYRILDEMLWRVDPEIDALRKLPFWKEFHRESGKRGLCVDRPQKVGRQCVCVAFTPQKTDQGGWVCYELSRGEGKTPLAAMEDAYRKSGRCDAELDMLWEKVCGRWVESTVEDDFAALFD
jgi:hypothetical protein